MNGFRATASEGCSSSFRKIAACFLRQPGLPFAGVLSADKMHAVVEKHDRLFAQDSAYSTSIVVWAFPGTVFIAVSSERRLIIAQVLRSNILDALR